MKQEMHNLQVWLKELEKSSLLDYSKIPDVPLYMEQVVSLIEEVLIPYSLKDKKNITSYMINNYVKDRLIDPPLNRKYEKDQVAYLIAICLLKPVVSMDNLKILLNKNNSSLKSEELYNYFNSSEQESILNTHHKTKARLDTINKKYSQDLKNAKDSEEKVKKVNANLRKQLNYIAFKLIIEAEVNKMFADRILNELAKKSKK